MSDEKLTTNMLILELSTMIVAIALALSAETINSFRLSVISIIDYIVVNIIVIWFWWRYITDRLKYPIKNNSFPATDVFLLIIISLLPVFLETGSIFYLSSALSILAFTWAFLLYNILKQYKENLHPVLINDLKSQINTRIFMGIIFLFVFTISFISIIMGRSLFLFSILIIIYNSLITVIRRRHMKKFIKS
jgi:hypothetical protein